MHLYRCSWPNGDVSFVLARNIDDAISRLDEFDSAERWMIERVSQFMVDFRASRRVLVGNARRTADDADADTEFPWRLAGLGECMHDPDAGILPSEETTLERIEAFRKQQKEDEREQKLRRAAVLDGSLVDLSYVRQTRALKRWWALLGAEEEKES